MTTKSEILRLIEQHEVLKDSELARLLGVARQQVNQAARGLAAAGAISRVRGPDGVIRNHLWATGAAPQGFQELPRRGGVSPSRRALPVLGCVVAGTPLAREDLTRLGFVEHQLEVFPDADVPRAV